MNCNNCNNKINENDKKCIHCGKEFNRKKISIFSIIFLIFLIISIIIPIIVIYYAISSSAGLDDISSQGYGWLAIFAFAGGIILATYFGSIFIINLAIDFKNKNIKNRNIIMSFLLLLPLLIVLFIYTISNLDINRKRYTLKKNICKIS